MAGAVALWARPAADGRVVVVEPEGGRPGAALVPPSWLDALLRWQAFAGLPPGDLAALWHDDAWVELGPWRDMVRRLRAVRRAGRLPGTALVFASSDVANVLKRRVVAALARAGLAELVFLRPVPRSARVLRLRLVADRPALATVRLWLRRLAQWRRGRCKRLPDGTFAGDIDGQPTPGDAALFEGLTQLVAVADPGEPIPRGGFACAGATCRFRPVRDRRWPPRLHWLVARSAAHDALLQHTAAHGPPAPPLAAVAAHLIAASRARAAAASRRVVLLAAQLGPGGAERQWCHLACGLAGRGWEVTFAVLEPLAGETAQYRGLLDAAGIVPVSLADGIAPAALAALARHPALQALHGADGNPFAGQLAALAALLDAPAPAALVAQTDVANTLAGLAGHVCGVPRIVLSVRNVSPRHLARFPADRYAPAYRALAAAPRIVWTANAQAGAADYADWLGLDPARFAVVPNGVDPQAFRPDGGGRGASLRAALGVADSAPVILGVFRLSDEKEPVLFLDVCARVAAAVPGLAVLVCGVGPLRKPLEAHAARLRLAGCRFLGQRADIADVYPAASLLLHTARHEGMPNAVMEAQACGVPVVATPAGDVATIVADGDTGLLAAHGDADALARACLRLLGDAALRRRMGAAGAARMRRDFPPSRMVDAYAALLGRPAP
jgi:glycosyltransferase involved in cell wall biosynthesis